MAPHNEVVWGAVDLEVRPQPGQRLEADPEAIAPEPSPRRAWWWVGAILAVLILLGGIGLWWYNAIGPGAYTTVPSVADETAEVATRTLTSVGFTVTSEERNDDEAELVVRDEEYSDGQRCHE